MSNDFKVLSEREHLLQRPAMYIGSTSLEEVNGFFDFKFQTKKVVPGLIKIINEIIDNSVDEFIRTNGEHANKIRVSILRKSTEAWEISVSDNGRGIPSVKIGDVYQAELAWTRARAGSNFNDDGRVTIGMNGVGSFATNCFSTEFIGSTINNNTSIIVKCNNNCSVIKTTARQVATDKTGTTVTFTPDLSRFGIETITEDHIEVIRDRLFNLGVCYPELSFYFNGEKLQTKNAKHIASNIHEKAITISDDNNIIILAPAGDDEEFRYHTYVNGLHMKNGGNHIDSLINEVISKLQPVIKRKHKIDVLPNQIRQHLMVAYWINSFPNPKFDSQTKERLTNTPGEIKSFNNYDAVAEQIVKKILSIPEFIDPMIAAILHKKELADARAANAALKKVKKKKIANHIQAQDEDWTKRRLYITEGLSAIGSLISVRNSKRDGGYALRGKVLNTNGMKPVEIVKNKELSELLTILELDLNRKTYDSAGYGEIIIMADQDPDGQSIMCLLLQFFSNWPQLFKEQRIKKVDTPLFIARKGKETKLYYTQAEYDKESSKLKGYDISYIKGLGSLETADYKEVVDNPRLTVIEWSGEHMLDVAFGDNAEARKVWMMNDE